MNGFIAAKCRHSRAGNFIPLTTRTDQFAAGGSALTSA
jgi:hypothetical protein